MTEEEILAYIKEAPTIRPKDFIISDLKWKYLVRSVLRGKHTLITGPSRSGKTKAVLSVAQALDKMDKFFYFNMGATQDARSALIGNTFFKKDEGTVFTPSRFYKAVTTPDALVMLDEVSRAHPDAWNILIPVLDSTQGYIRLEESEDQTTEKVAEGVCVVGTMNEGVEYTATRTVDKAIQLRFPGVIETDLLEKDDEIKLVKETHSSIYKKHLDLCDQIVGIACHTRRQYRLPTSKITDFISTGQVLEMVELVHDGFTLEDIADLCIYPRYPDDDGVDDERTYMRKLVQKSIMGEDITNPINDPVANNNPDDPDA